MLDLTSLLNAAGICLGLVVGDVAVFGDTMQVQITIPQKLVQAANGGLRRRS